MHDTYYVIVTRDGRKLPKPRVVQHRPLDRNVTYRINGEPDYGCRICYPPETITDERKAPLG